MFIFLNTETTDKDEDDRLGARLIKELDKKLKQVETEVRDAFKELEDKSDDG
jgi:hypothetical protein